MKTWTLAWLAAMLMAPLAWLPAADPAAPTSQPAGDAAKIADALKAIDAAKKAVEDGDKKAALAELDKAKNCLAAIQTAETPKFDNKKCPIMEVTIVPGKVPANLTREWKGKRIAFCCGDCPVAWDKLSDEEKEAKLKEANK